VRQLGFNNLGTLAYSYDQAGRRAQVTGSFARTGLPLPVSTSAYNADNQLTQWGTAGLTYDANGNMLSDGTNSFTWDARNHLVSMNFGANAFQYDPFGRRVAKTVSGTTTNYLYDGVNVAQELAGTTPTANLLSGGIDEVFTRADASGTGNFLTDALGSTLALADPSGNTLAQYTYEPFGNTTSTGGSTNSFQYTGRESDGTGLYFYRARFYNPPLERFISEDPLGIRGSSPNLYSYVLNSPINSKDPSGRTTVNLGGNISISTEGINIFNYSGGIVIDSNGNIAVYNTFGAGAAVNTGLSGSLSLTGGASSGRTVCSFGGPFAEVGGHAGLGPGGGAAGYVGLEKDGTPIIGGSVGAGVAGGAEAYDDITKTFVTPLSGRKSSCQ
jgi:RHS repeat-associated protein